MTQEERIAQYYRTGLWLFHSGRRADASLMIAAIRRYNPSHPLAARLRVALDGGDRTHGDRDDAIRWDDEAEGQRGFVRLRG